MYLLPFSLAGAQEHIIPASADRIRVPGAGTLRCAALHVRLLRKVPVCRCLQAGQDRGLCSSPKGLARQWPGEAPCRPCEAGWAFVSPGGTSGKRGEQKPCRSDKMHRRGMCQTQAKSKKK